MAVYSKSSFPFRGQKKQRNPNTFFEKGVTIALVRPSKLGSFVFNKV